MIMLTACTRRATGLRFFFYRLIAAADGSPKPSVRPPVSSRGRDEAAFMPHYAVTAPPFISMLPA